jgi:hypothetical protein
VVVHHRPYEGPESVWYILPDAQKETTDPEKCLRSEIEEYQAWAEGDVYFYVVEKAVGWKREDGEPGDMTTWQEEESCGSLIGHDWAVQAAKDALALYKTNV